MHKAIHKECTHRLIFQCLTIYGVSKWDLCKKKSTTPNDNGTSFCTTNSELKNRVSLELKGKNTLLQNTAVLQHFGFLISLLLAYCWFYSDKCKLIITVRSKKAEFFLSYKITE